MKTGKSISELATELERRANTKRDLIAKTDAIHMTDDARITLDSGKMDFGANEIFHDQLGGYLEIPAKYYDKCRAESPALLAHNVNTWLADKPEPRMIRTLDGNARAFLSDKYRPLENEDLAAAVLPVIQELDLDVMSCEVTERRLYIKAVDKRVTRELAKIGGAFGDGQHKIVRVASPALTISNSEVGMGALAVLTGVYDGFCSNLATFGERSMRKYHTGSRHELVSEEMFTMLSDKTRRMTDAAMWAQVREIVRLAFDQSAFNSLVDKIEGTAADKITGDAVKVIDLSSKRLGLSVDESKSVLRHFIEGGSLSRFGVYNAITRTAQDIESYDRATELERIGAQVIELPRNEWQKIAEAA